MNTSDYIASGAFLLSLGSFGYSIYSNNENTKNNIKREQTNYLKQLNRIINNINFNSDDLIKQNALNSIREELNFCTCYEDETSFQNFSTNIDDNFYMLCSAIVEDDFLLTKEKCLNEIQNFK
ncbi:hypothetical protein SAMN06314042_10244 [Epsilonproteobacteria bacterium SCGC AD-308-O04]|jgi:hypothetical protein|nr:hypothetical protein SAMN06314042_10244 [Epsilonproteobacteria bacterium SCGC AD-308-O04]